MVFLRKIGLLCLTIFFLMPTAFAAENFVVKNIQIQGLEGLSPATVINDMPVKIGQTITATDTNTIISALYQTGFFSNVDLLEKNGTLIVHVVERPTIASIHVSGNSVINTDQINSVLKQVGLVQGQVLDQSILDQVTKSLQSAYDMQGHYNAIVKTTVTPLVRHRVNVNIAISEGRVALVENIHITGNHAFKEKTLLSALTLTTPKWNSFYTHADHYSKDAFNQSMQSLVNYYLDHGYLHFKIDHANALLFPDRQTVNLVIRVTEGAQYTLSGISFTGNTILPPTQLMGLPELKALKPGMVFSRQKVMDATKAIANALGDQGYAFADISIVPALNEQQKTVSVTFHINPGSRVYVRRIHFTGNTSTADNVVRSAMRQFEGALVSTSAIDESIRQLNLLGFFQNVKESTAPVPGSQNQVDLNYSVTEQPSAQASISAGYGTDGAVFSTGVNESNFLGTGKQVGVNFVQSVYQRTYSFTYNNPYFTPEGVQRGFTLYNTKYMPGELNLAAYDFTSYGGNVTYIIPFTEKDKYSVGIGLQRTALSTGFNPPTQIQQFLLNQGSSFNQTMLTAGWSRNSLDKALFPTKGITQNFGMQISAPLIGTPLDYYKLTYQFHGYQPITHGFIGALEGAVGYGGGYGVTKGLPFFVNYYAGGLGALGQVRGYETNSLGPIDSTGSSIGGNALISASAQLILPAPLSSDAFRTSLFVDSGNVYNTWNVYQTYPDNQIGIELDQLRYSAGIDLQWRLPVLNAVIELSLATALNPKPAHNGLPGDHVEPFSFNIGGSF